MTQPKCDLNRDLCTLTQECKETADRILSAERILLQTLGFDLLLVHPYKLCLDKIKDTLRCEFCDGLRSVTERLHYVMS